MRLTSALFAGALLFANACIVPGDSDADALPSCPTGWTYDPYTNGLCRPPASAVASAEKALGDGVLGFAKLVTGTCNLCEKCTCAVDFLKGREVRAYAGEVTADTKTCTMPGAPLATTKIGDTGSFTMKLPKGKHTIVVFDPEAKCDNGRAVDVAGIQVVPIVMDYGAY
jgi:hypothetical protein